MYGVGVRVLLGASVLHLMGVLGSAFGLFREPFFDPACFSASATDCSWSWNTPTTGTQFCEMIVYNDNILNVCPNPIGTTNNDPNQRPPGPQNVVVTDDNRHFNQSTSQVGGLEQYTCLNITYQINRYASDKVKGIQLSVLGNSEPDLNLNYCLILNFSDTGLHHNAVLDFVFSNRCFCGLKPGTQYIVTIRTLPVDDNSQDPDDSKYQGYFKPSGPIGCNDPSKTNDVRCQKSEEAVWSPSCVVVGQNTASGEYDIVEIMFNVAPLSYNFDKYKVFVYQHPMQAGPKDWTILYRSTADNRTCPNSKGLVETVTHRFNVTEGNWPNTKGTKFIVRIWPDPTHSKQCRDDQNQEISCHLTSSHLFSLISNPCKVNPCGQANGLALGRCIPREEDHSCECVPGYMEWDHTCIADPCMVLADNGKNWERHCENGECLYSYSADTIDYYCNCSDGFLYLKTPKQCVADPCSINPNTSLTTCGPHALCQKNLTNDGVTHDCICNQGYSHQDDECKEEVSIGVIIGVALASCLIGLLMFVAVVFLFCHRRNPRKPNEEIPDVGTLIPDPPDQRPEVVFQTQRVLAIYSDDHQKHNHVIHCFCRFLQTHCQCEVSLMDWKTSVGPTVEMWLTAEIERAHLVLLLCSKGTGIKYRDKSQYKTPVGSNKGIYGDVFVKALPLLDDYFGQNNADKKFVVAYFDYSREEDIPVPFRRFARYCLMQCMESLYLRIHDRVKDSPHSSRRVGRLQEANYPSLEMGQPLYDAIKAMKELVKAQPGWYQLCNSISPQISNDSAYDSTHGQAYDSTHGQAYNSTHGQACMDFFNETPSSGRSSKGSAFDESVQEFLSSPVYSNATQAQPEDDKVTKMPSHQDNDFDQPETRFFSDDIHLTMNPGPNDLLQSSGFFSDVQIENFGRKEGRANSFV